MYFTNMGVHQVQIHESLTSTSGDKSLLSGQKYMYNVLPFSRMSSWWTLKLQLHILLLQEDHLHKSWKNPMCRKKICACKTSISQTSITVVSDLSHSLYDIAVMSCCGKSRWPASLNVPAFAQFLCKFCKFCVKFLTDILTSCCNILTEFNPSNGSTDTSCE